MKTIMKLVLFTLVILQLPLTTLTEDDFKINIHGYLSQGFLISNRNNFVLNSKKGTFHFNELGLNFTTQLTDRIHIGMQFAARDLGDKGNDKVIICWAFADYNWRDWLGIRIGKMKLPAGLYNKTRDIDMLRTFILLPQSVYPEIFRDAVVSMKGIGLYGVVSPGTIGNISYQTSIGTTEIDVEGSTVDLFESLADVDVEKLNLGRLFIGCLFWETPLKGLRAGYTILNLNLVCSGTLTTDVVIPMPFPPYDKITLAWKGDRFTAKCPNYQFNILSIEYSWNNLVLAAEYLKMHQRINLNVIDRYKDNMDIHTKSYYLSGTYRLSELFEFGINYSSYTSDWDEQLNLPPYFHYQKDLCAAVRFDLNSHWTCKLEGHLIKGAALCLPRNNLNDAGVPIFARRWSLFGAKVTYTF